MENIGKKLTLSELINECGDEFDSLRKHCCDAILDCSCEGKFEWEAVDNELKFTLGHTPEEAVGELLHYIIKERKL